MAKLALYILRLAAGREEQAPQLPDAKYSYLFKRRAKSAQGRNGIIGGDPRSGEEAVYAGFGLEQTQRSARDVDLTMPPFAIKLSQEPHFCGLTNLEQFKIYLSAVFVE